MNFRIRYNKFEKKPLIELGISNSEIRDKDFFKFVITDSKIRYDGF